MPIIGSTVIPGCPVSASRPRVSHKTGRSRAYYPDSHLNYEALCVAHLRRWWTGKPLVGPVALELEAVFERPSNRIPRAMGGTLSFAGARDLAVTVGLGSVVGWLPAYTERQDVDNLAKIVMDALQKAGVVANDSRVVALSVSKMWAPVASDECGMRVVVRSAMTEREARHDSGCTSV